MAVVQQAHEDVLGHFGVVLGASRGVTVPTDAKPVPVGYELGVISVHDVSRGDVLGIGPDGDRRAVHVRTTDHEHPVTDQALMAGVDIGWQVGAGQVAEVT